MLLARAHGRAKVG